MMAFSPNFRRSTKRDHLEAAAARGSTDEADQGGAVPVEYVKSWKLGKELGRGGIGVVRLGEKRNGDKVSLFSLSESSFLFFCIFLC
jgi:hypothetical protein